jgi:hypothetical protein
MDDTWPSIRVYGVAWSTKMARRGIASVRSSIGEEWRVGRMIVGKGLEW